MNEQQRSIKEICPGDVVEYQPPYSKKSEQIVVMEIGEGYCFNGTNFITDEDGQVIIGLPGDMSTDDIKYVIAHWDFEKVCEAARRSWGKRPKPLSDEEFQPFYQWFQEQKETKPKRIFP